jgi:hypothetical protein
MVSRVGVMVVVKERITTIRASTGQKRTTIWPNVVGVNGRPASVARSRAPAASEPLTIPTITAMR